MFIPCIGGIIVIGGLMKLYYTFDPLCVFCYGFHPLIETLYDEFKDRVEFEILPGGLWIDGHKKQVNNQVISNLKKATSNLTASSGRCYSEKFFSLLNTKPLLDSMFGLNAMMTALKMGIEQPFKYLDTITKSIFVEGMLPSDVSIYEKAAEKHGLNLVTFRQEFKLIDQTTYSRIKLSKKLGVSTYPTLLLEVDDQLVEYPLNYSEYQPLKDWLINFT